MYNNIRIDITSGIATNGTTRYGIIAYRLNPAQEVFRIDGISPSRDEVVLLIKMLTDTSISVSHFEKLIG